LAVPARRIRGAADDATGASTPTPSGREGENVQETHDRMNSADGRAGSSTARWLRWLAGATALLVLVQAVLIGRGFFADAPSLVLRHGETGNLTFLAAIALVVLAFVGWRRGNLGLRPLVVSLLLLVLVVAQLGLGYVGRESGEAAAWHVPNGVLIFGLTVALFGLAGGWARLGPAT
jgi:hypothetical protein